MAEKQVKEVAERLLSSSFNRHAPAASSLSDPIADTPMVVTLDELLPYELNPRIARNPLYEVIKASIRERGLDAPPAITRRPGAPHYIIRNGGNTRLAILRELWAETRNERFFCIACLFRPWSERGEIVALTGHLAENELHGRLTYIERALGVQKARELYEQENGQTLTQTELARRLTHDGYPVGQTQISLMQDTIRYLLPAIPNLLFSGVSRQQIERLIRLRKSSEFCWKRYTQDKTLSVDYETLFQDVISDFNIQIEEFSFERIKDELIGKMAEVLGVDYNRLELDINTPENRRYEITAPTNTIVTPTINHFPQNSPKKKIATPNQVWIDPAPPPVRLQTIQHLMDENLDVPTVTEGELLTVPDVWVIEPNLDTTQNLRTHIGQFAREIAATAGLDDQIMFVDTGIGYACVPAPENSSHPLLNFLRAMSADRDSWLFYLNDDGLFKLLRLLRLTRRLIELDTPQGSRT